MYVIHVNVTHPDQVASNGIHMLAQVEGQKGNVYVLPHDRTQQIEQKLAQFDH